jgi:uncharacterized protein YdeI (YjbR/CyaY-like superfamily)
MQRTCTFHAPDRKTWRAWLKQNHNSSKEVWLVYFKGHTELASISYEDSVEEALCFGWVDSIIQKIDEARYVRKFTPRRMDSIWSETNKRRVRKVIAEGRMTSAGLAKITYSLDATSPPAAKKEMAIPDWLKAGLQSNPKAWENFSKLPPSHQRRYVGWITSAMKEETQKKRYQEAISLLEKDKRLGIGPNEVRK